MAQEHWTNQDVFTQVAWNLRDEISNKIDEIKDKFDEVRPSEDMPSLFFHVNGGGDYGNGEGYDVIFETVNDPYEQEPGADVEFHMTSEEIGFEDVPRKIDVVQREVDGVSIYTVDADVVLEMLADWFALNADRIS